LILLQYTLAEKHNINERGVKDLLGKLPAMIKSVYIVFVVPRDRAIDYPKPQKSPDIAALGWHGKIKQYQPVLQMMTSKRWRLTRTRVCRARAGASMIATSLIPKANQLLGRAPRTPPTDP
jgi:hypothetical protein